MISVGPILLERDGRKTLVCPSPIGAIHAEVILHPDGAISFDLAPQGRIRAMTEQQIDDLTTDLVDWYLQYEEIEDSHV
jgi:hypothetical protein